ncbi:protein STB5 [Aspergillus udagawae]|uniref:Protein STB5 n=1 Tax=Aspergillus udagawae TaxID=91492 RepID=A0A8H3P6G9_9EURO|nr:protein STB5 [Aspergillus udagawae]
MANGTTARDKEFRDQLGKFRLESVVTSLPPLHPSSSSSQSQLQPRSVPPLFPPPNSSTASAASPLQPSHGTRPKRVSTACDFCRKRKKKCDFRYPNCSACTRAGVRCTVPPPGPQIASASVPRDQLENLQKRVEWLEDVLRRKTGTSVAEIPTGSNVDGEGDPDWWYQVPALMARYSNRHSIGAGSATTSSPAGSGRGSSTGPPASETSGFGTELPNVGEIFRDQLEHRRPSVARPTVSAPRVIRLPSLEEAERIASNYFDSMGYQYPFLSRPDFMALLRHIYAGGVPTPEDHYSYHITIAIALLIGSADDTQISEFYRASQQTLSLALQNEDLAAVRALLSLALYTMFATAGPSVWHVLGTAMRLATSLSLHKMRSSASLMEEEMAKRAFWSLYNLDRLIASTLGRPLGIADEDISVGLPREFNDDWTEVPGGSTMTIPVQVVKLRRLFSRIYRYLYNNQPPPDPQEVSMMLVQFRQELDDWRTSAPVYPPALLYSTSYYDYLYYTTLLLMYRPSPRNPTPDATSIVSCGDSSIQVIRSYWDSYSVGKIKWIWLTLSQTYFAGITILWCLEQNSRALRDGQPPLWQPDEQMMRRAIQAVIVLLEEFGKRRPGVERLGETFRGQSSMIFSQVPYQQQQRQQHPQQETLYPQPQPPPPPTPPSSLPAIPPPPVPLAPMLDDVLLVDGIPRQIDPQLAEQLFYSYDWFQEEMATYYTL